MRLCFGDAHGPGQAALGMSIRLTQIRTFNAVVRTGAFSRAAVRLGVSQPAVTAQIRSLEAENDILLFERRGRVAVTLTDAGHALFRVTGALDDIEEAATALLDRDRGRDGGSLTIATASPEVLMPLVARVRRHAPGLRLDIWVGSTREALTRLLDREADIGLFATAAAATDERLAFLPLLEQRLCALLPADHALAQGGSPIRLADLVAGPMVFRVDASETQQMANRALVAAGLDVRPVLRLDNRMAAYEAVASGLGACFVLERDVPRDPRVRALPLADVEERVWETICYLRRRREMPAIRRFMEVLDDA